MSWLKTFFTKLIYFIEYIATGDAGTPDRSPLTPIEEELSPLTELDKQNIQVMTTNPDVLNPDWTDPKHAYHNTRVLCDLAGLTVTEKNIICACIFQESRFKVGAIGRPNLNGTIDYGLCQYNNGNIKGIPLWIGPGATFSSIQDVFANPVKQVNTMISCYKAGHLNWWSSYQYGAYKQWLIATSPMWSLGK